MQIIAEAASFARTVGGLTPAQLSDLLYRYAEGPLCGYLLEITALLYTKEDDAPGKGVHRRGIEGYVNTGGVNIATFSTATLQGLSEAIYTVHERDDAPGKGVNRRGYRGRCE